MKMKRQKKFISRLKFYAKHYDWNKPFRVLVDGTFAKAALDSKVNLREQLPKYFDSGVELFTTPCCIIETESLGPELYGALQVLKGFAVHKCSHGEYPVAASRCMKVVATAFTRDGDTGKNAVKYVPATQDAPLRKKLGKVPGIPLLFLCGAAATLEKPSEVSKLKAEEKEVKKAEVMQYQREILTKMKQEAFGEAAPTEKKGTKKRKRAGPNPLSCKKSKKIKSSTFLPKEEEKRKRKRERIRLPKHVKEELRKMKEQQHS